MTGLQTKIMRRIDYIIIHCTATPQTATIESIQRYWRQVLKWKNPGYHFIIKPDGTPVNMQRIELISNGVAGHNAHSINISYIGGVETRRDGKQYPIDNRTDLQKKTMVDLLRQLKAKFPDAEILGHRDFSPDKNRNGIVEPNEWMKSCPSFSVRDWLKTVDLS